MSTLSNCLVKSQNSRAVSVHTTCLQLILVGKQQSGHEQVFAGSFVRVPGQMGSEKLPQEPFMPRSLSVYPEGTMASPGMFLDLVTLINKLSEIHSF